MTREEATKHLENMKLLKGYSNTTVNGVPLENVIDGIIALLKAQEPRVMTVADFENNHDIDDLGYLNAWVDYKDGNLCGWATICVKDVGEFVDVRRYWTSRPDEKRRAETPWN